MAWALCCCGSYREMPSSKCLSERANYPRKYKVVPNAKRACRHSEGSWRFYASCTVVPPPAGLFVTLPAWCRQCAFPTARGRVGEFLPLAGKAFGGHQRRTQGDLRGELLLGALGPVRQRLEQVEPRAEMADGVYISRALGGSLACTLPVGNGLGGKPCLGVVMSEGLRLPLPGIWKLLFQHLGYLLVILSPSALE